VLLANLLTYSQGRPCARASRALAHGLELKGALKFGKKEEKEKKLVSKDKICQ